MSMGKGGFQGPNTRAPGGGGMNQAGNPISGGMPTQFNAGGPSMIGGAYGQPIFGGRPTPGELYRPPVGGADPGFNAPMPQPGFGRFQPGGMIPPAGARSQVRGVVADPRRLNRYNPQPVIGNPRQVNPGQGPMQPGMPGGKGGFQGPMTSPEQESVRRYNAGPMPEGGYMGLGSEQPGNAALQPLPGDDRIEKDYNYDASGNRIIPQGFNRFGDRI